MDSHDIVHVAVLPMNVVEADLIRKVASITDKSPYITQMLLTGKVPRIVVHYSSLPVAEATVKTLQDFGFTAIACKNTEIRRSTNCFRAHTLQFDQKEITFRDKSNQTVKIESAKAFLIIRGIIEIHEDTEVIKTKMKLNLPITLLSGGIPIRRKVTEKTIESSTKTEAFIRVYTNEPSGSNVEITQSDFNYSCLGTEIAASSTVNINSLVIRIRKIFPFAVYDDRLTRYFGIDIPVNTPQEKINITCNLIYLFSRHSSNTRKEG